MEAGEPSLDENRERRRPTLAGAPWLLAVLACLIGILLLLVIVLAVLNYLRRGEKPALAVCDQPSIVVLYKGGIPVSDPGAAPTRTVSATQIPATLPPVITADAGTDAAPGSAGAPTATIPPGRPIESLAFLDLPFPYDGGNTNFGGTLEQFRDASQRRSMGGRINSFFDHYFPLYPASNDPNIPGGEEPAEAPVGNHVLLFTGELSPVDSYSGHPALDYSTFEHLQPTTPAGITVTQELTYPEE